MGNRKILPNRNTLRRGATPPCDREAIFVGADGVRPHFKSRQGPFDKGPEGISYHIYIMVVIALFAFLGCDKPARVDIGDLVEALQSLDHDVAVDLSDEGDQPELDADLSADEINTDDDALLCEEGEKRCESQWVMVCTGGEFVQSEHCIDCGALCQCVESAGNAWCEHTDPGPDDADMADKDVVEAEPDLSAETEAEVDGDDIVVVDADLADEPVDEDCYAVDDGVVVPDGEMVVAPSNVLCTGQTKCYNDDAEIACPSDGEYYYGQDSQYAAQGYCVPPSYSINGAANDDVVTDNITGLIWQRTLSESNYGWVAAGSYCKDLSYASYSDWRLPTRQELATLLNYGRNNPAIDTLAFPDAKSSKGWTSSEYVNDSSYAWAVDFGYGGISYVLKSMSGQARCVRGNSLSPGNFYLYTGCGEEMIVDLNTGLTWTRSVNAFRWFLAMNDCENLIYGGYEDWRLPNINEVLTLIDDTRYNPASNFPYMPQWTTVWSSTTSSDSPTSYHGAWYVHFSSGEIGQYQKSSVHPTPSYCVRSNKSNQIMR